MSLDNLFKKDKDVEEEIIEEIIEEKKPETPKEKVSRTPKPKKEFKVPDFNDFLQFCDKYRKNDFEVEQFYRHTMPIALYRKVYPNEKVRSGGGWSGAVKATINIMRKMKDAGVFN